MHICACSSTVQAAVDKDHRPESNRLERHGTSAAPESRVALLGYSELQLEREIGQGSYGTV